MFNERRKSVALKIAFISFAAVFICFLAGVTDYIVTVCFYREPLFCIRSENYYYGLGYGYYIEGNFENSDEDFFGAEYIEFNLFGKKIETIDRKKQALQSEVPAF